MHDHLSHIAIALLYLAFDTHDADLARELLALARQIQALDCRHHA